MAPKQYPKKYLCSRCNTVHLTQIDEKSGSPDFHTMTGEKIVCAPCLKDIVVENLKTNNRGYLYLQERREPEDYGKPFMEWVPEAVVDSSGVLKIAVLYVRKHRVKPRYPNSYPDRITYVWFWFDGSVWMGRNANRNTQVCWVKRTKAKLSDFGIQGVGV